MAGAKGSALEWALALLRAPAERHALRQRPLPPGMQQLIGIAAGAMPQDLADAAHSFGETEHVVREAAQFYAREVLFSPAADAYRTLGVDADADQEQIKLHYRLLQHWLHPDRLHSEDDAVFAARVNTAWNLLRNDARRSTYDQSRREASIQEVASVPVVERPVPAWAQHVAPAAPPTAPWMHRLPVLALGIACIALTVLAVRQTDQQPDTWRERLAKAADDTESSLAIAVPARTDSVAPTPAKPGSVSLDRTAVVSAPVPAAVHVPRERQIANPARPPTMASFAEAELPDVPAAAALAPRSRPSPEPAGQPISRPLAFAPALPVGQPAMLPPPPPAPAPAAPSRTPAPALAVAAPVRAAAAPVSPSPPPPSAARIRLAQRAGGQLLRYMGEPGRAPPPVWNSPAIQSSASQLRQELQAQGRIRLAAPDWRIGEQSASFTATYRTDGPAPVSGSVSADMVWRDGQWLVTGLSVERAQ